MPRISAGAIIWSLILALDVLPRASLWMLIMVIFSGVLAGIDVGLWKLYTTNHSTGTKAGLSVAIFGVISVLISIAWRRLRPGKR